eukprot:CAMPEP_0114587484 /NCGR_PEP_ID=MMETSP0125-20121206/10435_1 /TAXON_ID=485358 ORGANISM="Aristerostoma sp., Strain ATCC 50986" /NCGR_SAMPLE_ID=MMETSP0125 /ASSEMBLY_ACC=CAM_ASM_000245 /LENGTH=128 /DNA_ID=CAMNT_0001783423 /DNA_START=227 /DNA_END=614 /DNA_ORIENTATION=-
MTSQYSNLAEANLVDCKMTSAPELDSGTATTNTVSKKSRTASVTMIVIPHCCALNKNATQMIPPALRVASLRITQILMLLTCIGALIMSVMIIPKPPQCLQDPSLMRIPDPLPLVSQALLMMNSFEKE